MFLAKVSTGRASRRLWERSSFSSLVLYLKVLWVREAMRLLERIIVWRSLQYLKEPSWMVSGRGGYL